jgi:hypothetical protein
MNPPTQKTDDNSADFDSGLVSFIISIQLLVSISLIAIFSRTIFQHASVIALVFIPLWALVEFCASIGGLICGINCKSKWKNYGRVGALINGLFLLYLVGLLLKIFYDLNIKGR